MHSAAVALMQTVRDIIAFWLATCLSSCNTRAAVEHILIASGGSRMRSDCDQRAHGQASESCRSSTLAIAYRWAFRFAVDSAAKRIPV